MKLNIFPVMLGNNDDDDTQFYVCVQGVLLFYGGPG